MFMVINSICQDINKYKPAYIQTLYMEKDEMMEDGETKATMKVPTVISI